jgi:hypothetical protein
MGTRKKRAHFATAVPGPQVSAPSSVLIQGEVPDRSAGIPLAPDAAIDCCAATAALVAGLNLLYRHIACRSFEIN